MNQKKHFSNIKNNLAQIAIQDAIQSSRTNDALREALTSSLFKKTEAMSAQEIIDAIKTIDSYDSVARTKELLSLLSKS